MVKITVQDLKDVKPGDYIRELVERPYLPKHMEGKYHPIYTKVLHVARDRLELSYFFLEGGEAKGVWFCNFDNPSLESDISSWEILKSSEAKGIEKKL